MRLKRIYLLLPIIAACAGCASNESVLTATPNFATAVLPTSLPQGASTFEIPVPAATIASTPVNPVEGTTTTQVNVRAQSSTASTALGVINIFTKVQIIGKDSTGSWYRIVYADSSGWVRAEFVQVNAGDEIPIAASDNSASGGSALVVQKINVRKGPGTNFEPLGALNPNDIVFIIGRDSSGVWAQIEFAGVPDGKGWAAIEFLKIDNADTLPVIGAVEPTAAPVNMQPTVALPTALQDGDSMQAPLGTAVFSQTGARALQLNGDVSAPTGDTEDWLQFTSYSRLVSIKIQCADNDLVVELWKDGTRVDGVAFVCGSENLITVTPDERYFLRLSAPASNEFHYINYVALIKSVQ